MPQRRFHTRAALAGRPYQLAASKTGPGRGAGDFLFVCGDFATRAKRSRCQTFRSDFKIRRVRRDQIGAIERTPYFTPRGGSHIKQIVEAIARTASTCSTTGNGTKNPGMNTNGNLPIIRLGTSAWIRLNGPGAVNTARITTFVMTLIETLTQRNEAFASSRFSADLKLMPSMQTKIIGCVDPRAR